MSLPLMELRRAIEPAVAELAALRAKDHEILVITDAFRAMEKADTLQSFSEADLAFHRSPFVASGNPVFMQLEVVLDPPAANVPRQSAFCSARQDGR